MTAKLPKHVLDAVSAARLALMEHLEQQTADSWNGYATARDTVASLLDTPVEKAHFLILTGQFNVA